MKEATILIIDDSPVNVALLETTLKREGFQTIKAENGPEGRRLAGLCSPDLVLLDIVMPGESGFETCSGLKLNPRTTNIPVIFVSTIDEATDKVKAFSLGAVDYVTKPFNRQELIARVRVHVKLKLAVERADSLVTDQESGRKARGGTKTLSVATGFEADRPAGEPPRNTSPSRAGGAAPGRGASHAYVHLRPGEYHVTKKNVVIRTVLGSCVSACLWDETQRIVGMNHFLLVNKSSGMEKIPFREAGKYGESAMKMLIDDMRAMGARLANLKAKVFGGAYIMPVDKTGRRLCVGDANSRFVVEFLRKNGIPIISSDLGGGAGRVIRFSSADFSVYVKTVKAERTIQGL